MRTSLRTEHDLGDETTEMIETARAEEEGVKVRSDGQGLEVKAQIAEAELNRKFGKSLTQLLDLCRSALLLKRSITLRADSQEEDVLIQSGRDI